MSSTVDGSDVRQVFDRLLDEEPAMALDAGAASRLGRRLRRRRQVGQAASALGACGLLAGAVVVATGGDRDPTAETASPEVVPAAWLSTSADGVPVAASSAPPESDLARQVVAAVQAGSPEGWAIDLRENTTPGITDGVLEGTADDGAGPGHLMVHVTREPGTLTLRPCDDPEFVQGGSCDERILPDGSVLSVRGLVDFDGIRYVDVSLVHPDGSGVGAESGNFVIPELPPAVDVGPDGRVVLPELITGRPEPTYTAEQLADLVVAVDQATR